MTRKAENRLPYPPPWQDISTLCAHLCISENTVDAWVSDKDISRRRACGFSAWIERNVRLPEGSSALPGTIMGTP